MNTDSSDDVDNIQESPIQVPCEPEDGDDDTDLAIGSILKRTTERKKTSTSIPDKYYIDDEIPAYKMDHKERGYFIIINIEKFHKDLQLRERTGTNLDAIKIKMTFESLGFSVKHYHNLSKAQMVKLMHQVSKEDHSDSDCFACAILSHGEAGQVYGYDGKVKIDTLVEPFKTCDSLLGKPKLFFIQACRGDKFDAGWEVDDGWQVDSPGKKPPKLIPIEADFLFAYSTVPGYVAWKNSANGSWFIQTLCDVITNVIEKYQSRDILQILTRTNYEVVRKFESNYPESNILHKKKQIPSIVSMLRKELIFTAKQK